MSQDREPYLIDASPQLIAVMLLMRHGMHPNDMQVALGKSRAWVRDMISRAKQFLDHRPDQDD